MAMTKDEAKEKFRLADRLFAEQQFAPALKVLTELNAAFPDERHVLYPMARCLTALGRHSEALDLADRIVRQFNYGPAIELYKRIKELKTGTGLAALESQSDPPDLPPGAIKFDSDPIDLPPGVAKFDSGPIELPAGVAKFDSDPVVLPAGVQKFDSDLPKLTSEFDSMVAAPARAGAAPPPLPAASEAAWAPKVFWIGMTAAALAMAVIVALTAGRPLFEFFIDVVKNAEKYSQSGESPVPPEGLLRAYGALWISNLVLSYATGYWSAYWSVSVLGVSRFGDFSSNMKDAAIWAAIGTALGCIPILGWILLLVLLKDHYELSVGQLFGLVGLFCGFQLVFSVVLGGIYLGIVFSALA